MKLPDNRLAPIAWPIASTERFRARVGLCAFPTSGTLIVNRSREGAYVSCLSMISLRLNS